MAVRKNSRSRQQTQRGSMPWGPMLLSFVVGAFVMFLIHLKDNVPADNVAETTQQQQPKRAGIQPTFDFYTLLPESEEVVVTPRSGQQTIVTSPPEQQLPIVEELAEPTAPASTPQPTTQTAVPQTPPQDSFIVQVGSFRKLSDADGFRANLALLGFESKVQTVTIDDKDTWHRVQVGPVFGREQADNLQRRLRENNIDSLLLRAKHS